MPLDLHYIANLKLGSKLDKNKFQGMAFEIHDKAGQCVDSIQIQSVCSFDGGRADFLNSENPARDSHGYSGCWIIRGMVNGKPATDWTSADDDIVKCVWVRLVECRLTEDGCKDEKEFISKRSMAVQLTLMAICHPAYPELFKFITGQLGEKGLKCISAYDECFNVIPFFYNTTIVVPGKKMIDVIFGGWLSKVFIDVYLNKHILIELRSAIHESLTSYAFTSQKKADHVLRIFEEHRDYFSKNEGAATWGYVHNWYSLIAGRAKAPLKIKLKNQNLSNQLKEVMFSKDTPLDRLIKMDLFPNVVKSGDCATIEALIKHGGNFSKAHSILNDIEQDAFLRLIGQEMWQRLFNVEKLLGMLKAQPELTETERARFLENDDLIKAAEYAESYKGLMQALKSPSHLI